MRQLTRSLLGAVFALSACARSPSESSALGHMKMVEPAVSESNAAIVAPPPSPVVWQAGKQYGYQLKLGTQLDFGDQRRAFDFDLSGKLRVIPVRVTGGDVSLYLTIDEAKIVSRVPGSQPSFDKVASEVGSTGCFFDLVDGRVRDMRVAPELSGISANIYRDIGADLQFAGGAGEDYESTEYDTTGRYVAEYKSQPDALHWQKRKLRYLDLVSAKPVSSSGPSRIVPTLESSAGDVELSASGRVLLVRTRSQVVVNGAQVPVRSSTSLSLDSSTEQIVPPNAELDWNTLLAKTMRVEADAPYGGQASVDALDDARIHGQNFQNLFKGLTAGGTGTPVAVATPATAAAAQSPTLAAGSQDFIALAALFRRKPGTIDLALDKIHAGAAGSDILIDALGSASSPQTEQTLIGLLDDKTLEPKLRTRALRALTRVQRPTDRAIAVLKGRLTSAPFDESALWGLGTYSRRLRDAGNEEQATAIGEFLLEKLKSAKTESALVAALGALTNAGYAKALGAVQATARDTREPVRVAAVRALQSMQDPAVDGILATSMKSDPSSEVRISAMDAAQVREPTDEVADALSAVAVSASEVRVRFRAVELMLQWLRRRPGLRSTLELVASRDPEPKVRERARSAL
jgi:hypothetical protein